MRVTRRPSAPVLVLFVAVVVGSLAGAAWLGFGGSFVQSTFKGVEPTPSDVRIGHLMLVAAVVAVTLPWAAMWAYTRDRRWGAATATVLCLGVAGALYSDGMAS